DDIISTTVDQVLTRAETDLNGEVLQGIQAEAQYAAQNGLRLLVYEGGHHLAVAGRDITIGGQQLYDLVCVRNQDIFGAPACDCQGITGICDIVPTATYNISGENIPDFVALMSSATHNPRMRQLYNRMFDLWFQNGGDIFNVYKYINYPSKWGLWGTLDYATQLDTQAPMYQGVMDSVTRYLNFVPGGAPPPTAVCGNSIIEGSEQCDDGNTVSGDGCSSTCQSESPPPPPPSVNAMITVNPSQTYQTMRGWEANIFAQEFGTPNNLQNHSRWMPAVVNMAVNELGINRGRVELTAGSENPNRWNEQYVNGRIQYRDDANLSNSWRNHRYEIINDNNDPNVINWNAFDFALLDLKVNSMVIPLRNQLTALGKNFYFSLNYVGFTNGDTIHSSNPNEYAEFMLAAFIHMNQTFGFVPDAVEIILEPDVAGWANGRVGPLIVATEARLRQNGYTPEFIGPSNTNMWNAYNEFTRIETTPGAANLLAEASFHRYNQAPTSDLQQYANIVSPYGIGISMLEHWDPTNTYIVMHDAIRYANTVAWQQGVLGGNISGSDITPVTLIDTPSASVVRGSYSRYYQQYFRDVDLGAVRIDATSSNEADYNPLAFVNPDGLYTIIVNARNSGGTVNVTGLPAGTYASRYTTASAYDQAQSAQAISSGGALTVTIPASGVITIYQTTSSAAVCGNGMVEMGEQCDDGNTANNDGCSSVCLNEVNNGGTTIGTAGPESKTLLPPPIYSGTCPVFNDGQNSLSSSGNNRNFLIRMPTGVSSSDTVPVVFAWHGIGADMFYFQTLITPLVPANVMVVTMEYGPSGTWTYGTDPSTNDDLRAFDDIIACLNTQFNTNPNNFNIGLGQIYSTGHSLGGLFNTYLTMHRANRLGASVSFSGGTYSSNPYTTPNAYIPALFSWGGPNDIGGGFAFNQPNLDASTSFAADGNFVVQCQHSEFHSIPVDAANHLWPFFRDHWIGQTIEPYQNGLPYNDPNYPFTSYCVALPYTPTTPPTITIGDVSAPQLGTTNGLVDNQDVLLMVDHILGTMMLNMNAQTAADTTCDQRIDVRDILAIFRSIRGLGSLPVSCP
ncbi:MAG: DUF4215 domain-containing protein, partial [Nanoarchaeota archaeon]|nr:DUF4215 domain-containing protein [Nanoarchaeota archaeon]